MSDNCGNMLQMGVVGRAHGIKGEIAVDWHGISQPHKGQTLYIMTPEAGLRSFVVKAIRHHKDRPLVLLEGLEDRTAAEKLIGAKIFIPRDSLPPPEDNEAYVQDLPGCGVYLPDGAMVGILDHVEYPANQEVWAIRADDGREILFPAQPCFIRSLDVGNKKICIDPPPGLLDIYNA